MHVSITGLRLRRPWHFVPFYWHAMRSMQQARTAHGNISTDARTIDGVHHTLTAWTSQTAMRDFLYSGAHKRAIAAFPSIGTGVTFGFETDTVPSWDEAHKLWRNRCRTYSS